MLHLEPYYKLVRQEEQPPDEELEESDIQAIGSKYAYNKEAHKDFLNSFEDLFVEKCKICSDISQEERYNEPEK